VQCEVMELIICAAALLSEADIVFTALHACNNFFHFFRTQTGKQVAQLSQRDRAAGWASFGQKWKTGTGRQYFAYIIGLTSTTVT